jgi:hypothetical protein
MRNLKGGHKTLMFQFLCHIFPVHFERVNFLVVLYITKLGLRLTIGYPPLRGSSIKTYFSKEGLTIRTLMALVKVLYLNGNSLKIEYCLAYLFIG